jgi:hypothetical protein
MGTRNPTRIEVEARECRKEVERRCVLACELDPAHGRGRIEIGPRAEHAFAAVARDRNDRHAAPVRAGRRGQGNDLSLPLEAAVRVVRDIGLRPGDVGARDAGSGLIDLPRHPDLDGPDARRVERPAADRKRGSRDLVRGGRVDGPLGTRRGDLRLRRFDRLGRRALALMRDQRVDLDAGQHRDDGKERGEPAHRASGAGALGRALHGAHCND